MSNNYFLDLTNKAIIDIYRYEELVLMSNKYLKLKSELVEKLEKLISYGDEWNWNNGSIRDDVLNIYELITGRKYEDEEGE